MPPKQKLKKGKGKNARRNVMAESSDDEPLSPSRSSRKRRAARTRADASESSTDEVTPPHPAVQDALTQMSSMMATMSARLEGLEDRGRDRRRVTFDSPPVAEHVHLPVAEESRASSSGASADAFPPPPHEQQWSPTDVFSAAQPRAAPEEPPTPRPSTSYPPTTTMDVSDAVRARVALRLQAAPAPFFPADEEVDSEGEGGRRRQSKSGKIRNQDTHVFRQVLWPHELVNTAGGNTIGYSDLSLAGFTEGYLNIMCFEKDKQVSGEMLRHLKALLQDVDDYGWWAVRDYHAAWLQLIEQGRATWLDEGERALLRRRMVWSKPSVSQRSSTPSSRSSAFGPHHPPTPKNQDRSRFNPYEARAGEKVCGPYNRDQCQNPAAHPAQLHRCAYCLRVANMLFRHPETACNRKAAAKNGAEGV